MRSFKKGDRVKISNYGFRELPNVGVLKGKTGVVIRAGSGISTKWVINGEWNNWWFYNDLCLRKI